MVCEIVYIQVKIGKFSLVDFPCLFVDGKFDNGVE